MAKKKKKGSSDSSSEKPAGRPPAETATVEQGDPGEYNPQDGEGMTPSEAARAMIEDGTAERERARVEEGQPSEEELTEEMREQAREEGTYDEGDGPEPGDRVRLEELGADPESTMVEVQVDGEKQEVSLEEAVNGYQRQSAFTKKTQELAEKRQAVSELQQRLEGDLQALSMIGEQLPPQVRQKLAAEYQQVQEQMSRVQQQHVSETVAEERELLKEKMGWASDEDAQEGAERLREYVTSGLGFEESVLNNVHDHRVLLMAEKARKYDALQGKRTDRAPKGDSPTLQPGNRSPKGSGEGASDEYRRALSQLGETGSKDAAAAAILSGDLLD